MSLAHRSTKTQIADFMQRYHLIIFFVVTITGLSVAIFFLNRTIVSSDEPGTYTSQVNNTSLDQSTIKQLRALKESDESTKKLDFSGRTNPFGS